MFEIAWLVYIVVCGIVFGIVYRHDRREGWTRFALAASLPVVGFLLPLFRSRRNRANQARPVESGMFDHFSIRNEEHSSLYDSPDTVKELNVVPLEEALLVNDFSTRRRVMIDLLKQDSLDYLEVLRLAVSNEDTETSHYAVSAITGIKSKLTLTLQQLSVQYEENKDDSYLLRSYADVLKNYMRSGFLDERTISKHRYTYSAVLARLLELEPESAEAYAEKIEMDLELGEYASAEACAESFLRHCPHDENAYLCLMNVYFTVQSIEKLKDTLDQLKQSPIRLSNEALTTVRFWSEGT
ncbi:tetratricopeptide repeat protein [Paenibacillus oceani]|uniref:Uncharacterized protein n=1 Tax=Paenibacillus oceani TaxID=2772510 RepID=A0A927H1E2_9BACL|nr:tetratricopeptide repeat protein [Paenibacillus oceani]MBD2864243.1 hypothetical protein [Paenibacillus oceani]